MRDEAKPGRARRKIPTRTLHTVRKIAGRVRSMARLGGHSTRRRVDDSRSRAIDCDLVPKPSNCIAFCLLSQYDVFGNTVFVHRNSLTTNASPHPGITSSAASSAESIVICRTHTVTGDTVSGESLAFAKACESAPSKRHRIETIRAPRSSSLPGSIVRCAVKRCRRTPP